jgi:hypothetical protein
MRIVNRLALSKPILLTTSLVLAAILFVACGDEDNAVFDAGETAGAGGSGGAGGGAPSVEGIPCDVAEILNQHCWGCHTDPPKFGAPMSLSGLEALADYAPAIRERLYDSSNPMPPNGEMSEDERATLDAWLAEGAPAYDGPPCEELEPPEEIPIGPDALDCEPTHTFVAHADGSDDAYHVPETGAENLYQCFTFKSPFDGVQQATAWAPIVDDERVLHHWILYRTATPQPDGGVTPCNMPQDATFVAGWAPGGQNFTLPENVGLELAGPDDYFILQMHYHNTPHYADSFDKSGVALCTTDTPRENAAGVFTLGSVSINIPPFASGHQAIGECKSWMTNLLPEPVHAIASFPHMHEYGTEFRTEVFRGADDGPKETLVEIEDWVFDNQRYYEHDPAFTIYPGDSIRTTCTFDNTSSQTVTFGEKTEDEMCFNFVMLYPIDIFDGNRTCGLF